jgi:hypothetical protein
MNYIAVPVKDTLTGKAFPSQSAMIRDEFPRFADYLPNNLYWVYDKFPMRFMLNPDTPQARYAGRNKVHLDVSDDNQIMVLCGLDNTNMLTRDVRFVTCKNCIRLMKGAEL